MLCNRAAFEDSLEVCFIGHMSTDSTSVVYHLYQDATKHQKQRQSRSHMISPTGSNRQPNTEHPVFEHHFQNGTEQPGMIIQCGSALLTHPQSETLVFSYHRLVFKWPTQGMCMSMAG